MALETVTYISDLVPTNPTATDQAQYGDDHLRNIKSALKTTFPNVAGAVTPSHVEFNYVTGVTSGIQAQFDAHTATLALKATLASPALTGTPTAPTAAAGTATTQIATCAYVVSTAFSSALPGQTSNAGKVITTDGSSASWVAVASKPWTTVSGTTQAATAGVPYLLTNASATTVTLPATPAANDIVIVKVANGRTDNIINPNGSTIEGTSGNMTIDGGYAVVTLQYLNSSWRIV